MSVAELVDLAVGQPAGGLVEHQQLGLGGERPGDLDALERAVRQAGARSIGECVEVEPLEDLAWTSRDPRSSLRTGGIRRAPSRNPPRLREWAPTITFSSTVSAGNSARFWNVRVMPSVGDAVRRERRAGRCRRTGRGPRVGS